MADVYGVSATKAFNTTPSEKVAVNIWGGRMRSMTDIFEGTGNAIGTDIIVGRLPKGAQIQSGSRILCDALGASSTLALSTRSVADGTTEVAILPATASSSAAIIAATISEIATFPLITTEEVDIIVTVAGGTVTGTIQTEVEYVAD